MLNDMPALTYEQQQQAVERIQTLMADGMRSSEAIALVVRELRATTTAKGPPCAGGEDEEEIEAHEAPLAALHEAESYNTNPDDD